jgi:phosphonopyruvate decarboxylase
MKLDPLEFYNLLLNKEINFFTGVPDSLLKELNNVILKKSSNHVITANEGSAIALGAGYYLSTSKIPLIYLQNSGTGNIINPLMSLVSEKVYSIPMLIVIGWRGEPGVKDEPQHLSQGECMVNLIKSLNIDFNILPFDISESEKIINDMIFNIKCQSKPNILLVRKNTFSKFSETNLIVNNYNLFRKQAIESIVENSRDNIILSTTGKISRELVETMNEQNLSQENIFLNVGAMGHVSMISLGIAKNTEKNVLCLDGDGSVIMHMGNLTTIGTSECGNLIHVVLNNGMHESVGIQPTTGFEINLTNIAKNCGYSYVNSVSDLKHLEKALSEIKNTETKSPSFLEINITNKINYTHELSRPKDTPLERKNKFMEFINK